MQVVVNIPDDTWVSIQNGEYCGILNDEMYKNIKNGKPLPAGHGRLIDEKELGDTIARMWENRKLTNTKYNTFLGILDYIPTVIEADGGDKDAGSN